MKNYRWVVCTTLWLITFIAYLDRVNLSVAATSIMSQFNLSATQFGLILGAMIPGYVAFSFIGGIIADRFSPLRTISIAIIIWSVCTGWFAFITNFAWLYISRVFFGAAEGLYPPTQLKMYSNWMLPQERGRVLGVSVAMSFLGIAVGAPICGAVIKNYSWQTLFMGCAVVGILYFLLVNIFVRSSPSEHPWITSGEKELIEKTIQDENMKKGTAEGKVPTRQEIYDHLKNPYVWVLGLGYFSVMAIFWANITWLPGYLVKEKGFTVFQSGYMSSIPYFTGVVGMIAGGLICDKYLKGRRTWWIIFCQVIGPPLVFVALGATSNAALIVGFGASMFFTAGTGQFWVLTMDLLPLKMTGLSSGILTGVGYLGGMATPVIMGRIYDVTHSFYWGFGSVAIVCFMGAIIAVPLLLEERRIHTGTGKAAAVCAEI